MSKLNALGSCGLEQRLGIGVEHSIADSLQFTGNHAIHRIAATATDPYDLNACRLTGNNAVGALGILAHLLGLQGEGGWVRQIAAGVLGVTRHWGGREIAVDLRLHYVVSGICRDLRTGEQGQGESKSATRRAGVSFN